jgi:hypothetical protein
MALMSVEKGLNIDPNNPRLLLARRAIMAKSGAKTVKFSLVDQLRHAVNLMFFHKKPPDASQNETPKPPPPAIDGPSADSTNKSGPPTG